MKPSKRILCLTDERIRFIADLNDRRFYAILQYLDEQYEKEGNIKEALDQKYTLELLLQYHEFMGIPFPSDERPLEFVKKFKEWEVKEPIWPENWKCSKHGEAWSSSDKYPKGCCECHEAFCANKMKTEMIKAWKDAQKG